MHLYSLMAAPCRDSVTIRPRRNNVKLGPAAIRRRVAPRQSADDRQLIGTVALRLLEQVDLYRQFRS